MTITLIRSTRKNIYHDPANNYELKEVFCEIRHDPLNGKITRIIPSHNLELPVFDWASQIKQSQSQCPFCPPRFEEVTPRFPEALIPEGRIYHGDAVVIPNIALYEKYTAVVVMSSQHYFSYSDLTVSVIESSFNASLEFLKRANAYDPEGACHSSINWNYMPFSGGTLIHPHLQVLAGPEPGNYDRDILEATENYFNTTGNNFWSDLIEQEIKAGERYLGQVGNLHWLVSFAPRATADVTVVFPGRTNIHDLTSEDIQQFANGLQPIFKYYDSHHIPSFNVTLYPGPIHSRNNGYWTTARITGRYSLQPMVGTDTSYLQVFHNDPWSIIIPEKVAEELRKHYI